MTESPKTFIIANALNRRLQYEYQYLSTKYDKCEIIYSPDKSTLLLIVNHNNKTYNFDISANYPFVSPNLTINGKKYVDWFKIKTPYFNRFIKYISGIDCLCCASYLNRDNWSPSFTIDIIIKQSEEFINYKYLIFIKIILDKIKSKYLLNDIDLESWLFIR